MQMICRVCDETFASKRSSARYCSERCKKRYQRGAGTEKAEKRQDARSVASSVATATLFELQEAGRLHTSLGQAALALAHRLDAGMGTDQGAASLAKQLQATLEAATADVQVEDDPVDELRAARERLRASAAG